MLGTNKHDPDQVHFLSVELDDQGRGILRIVDAAPFAYNPDTDKLKVENIMIGSTLEEQLTNADAVDNVLTFSKNITNIEIYHNEANWQEFVVNGITLTIPAGVYYRTAIGGVPGLTVGIPVAINCVVGRLV